MSEPLTDEERRSFREYANDNRPDPDGSKCQWADYTIRLLGEVEELKRKPKDGERILTPCPACGRQSLFIGDGGHLTCSRVPSDTGNGCENPGVEEAIKALRQRAEKAERERDERVKELEEHLAFYRDEPVCDFAKLLARRLYYDINDVPSIETVGEWTDAVSAAIDAAVVERMRSLPDRMWEAALDAWKSEERYMRPLDVARTMRDWLRREVERLA